MSRACLALCLVLSAAASAADASKSMLELKLDGQRIEGLRLAWSQQRVYLLGRDGRLWEFAPGAAEDFHKLPGLFAAYSPTVMRNQVQNQLGRAYEVTGTGRYLVAHPAGEKGLWADRFENLYRSFVHYFSVRGFKLKTPEFPLVAIVLPDHKSFQHYAMADGRQLPPGVLGYYSPVSNRIALYDTAESADWTLNAETIIHEATHQTAFNTGIHSRFADQPRWAVEGLAMLFEAPGVWDSRNHPGQKERLNRRQLEAFRQFVRGGRPKDSLAQLISSDKRFEQHPLDAYAEAWAFSFFLIESHPRKYADYLQRLAAIPAFSDRTSAQRLSDFTAVFGSNFALLDAQFLRFVNELK